MAGLSLGTVIQATNRYLHETSKDHASRLRHETAKRHSARKYTFQSLPWPVKEDWNHIEALHPLVLELSSAHGKKDAEQMWRKAMKQLRDTPEIDRLTPVHEKVSMANRLGGLALPPRSDLSSITLPSAKLLDGFDPDRRMSADELREAIRDLRYEFEDMVQHPIQYEGNSADKPLEEILDLYESFYILEPIEIRWGRWGTFKCCCEDFMGAA